MNVVTKMLLMLNVYREIANWSNFMQMLYVELQFQYFTQIQSKVQKR